METIKLTTPWNHKYYSQSSEGKGIFVNFSFQINNDCDEADWWIIWGGVNKKEYCKVNPERIIYITDEAYPERSFNPFFLKQFSFIATVRTDIPGPNVIRIHEFAPWYFNKNYDEIANLTVPTKTKSISVISSDLTLLPGHKKRFAFVNKLIGHFKDRIDIYGRGFNEIPDKYDALIDYKYSIAIENNVLEGYFTEKISECFLTYTLPVYFGCPDIEDYYDQRSIVKIDIDDYKSAFRTIEELVETDTYYDNLKFIIDSREKYLYKYHMFPALIELIKKASAINELFSENRRKNIFILPEIYFSQKAQLISGTMQLVKGILTRY